MMYVSARCNNRAQPPPRQLLDNDEPSGTVATRDTNLEEKFDIEIPLSLDNSELDFLTVGDVLKAVNTLTRKAQ